MDESSNPKKRKSLLTHGDDDFALTASPSKKRRRNWKPAPLTQATNRKQLGTCSNSNDIWNVDSCSEDEIEILRVVKPLATHATTTNTNQVDDDEEEEVDRKPTPKRSNLHLTKPTTAGLQKRQQPNDLSVTGFDNVIDLTDDSPNDMETDAALARSLAAGPREEAGDAEFARALDAKLRKEANRAKGAAELAMLKTSTGKAWKFVEGVLSVHERLSKEIQHNASPDFIKPIAVDDMVALAERLVKEQEEFRAAGKPCLVDLGYHWTTEANLQSIQTGGLLTKQERDSSNVKAKHNGSAYGDGIYTAHGPSHTWNQQYGNIGLMVARLHGRTGSHIYDDAVDTVVPIPTWAVLRSSSQCVALVQFRGSELNFDDPSCPSTVLVKPYHKALQRLINELLNVESGSVPEEPQCASGWAKPQPLHVLLGAQVPARMGVPNQGQAVAMAAPAPPVVPNRAQALATAGKRALAASRTSARAAAASTHLQTVFYQSPNSLADQSILHLPIECYASSCDNTNSQCSLCNSQKGSRFTRLKACGHEIHEKCLRSSTKKKPLLCPVCKKRISPQLGRMPTGTMSVSPSAQRGFLMITYVFGNGIQKAYHTNPGQPYNGATLRAYIPDDTDGRRLLGRLTEAFHFGLTFDIFLGAIVWGPIPHKTHFNGGAQNNGFPDGQFFQNCNAALDALNVSKSV